MFVSDLAQSLYLAESFLSPSLSFTPLCVFIGGDLGLRREFDALIRPWYVFSKATLHVRSACAGERAVLLIHILCKIQSVLCGGTARLEDEAHGQKAWLTVTACSLTGSAASGW